MLPKQKKGRKRNKGNALVRGNGSSEEKTWEADVVPLVRVKGQIQPRREMKFVDVGNAAYVLDTTGTVTLLNGIAEGDDYSNRNSRSAIVHSVAVRGYAQPTTATGVPIKFRIMLVWDNAADGVIATIAQILAAANVNAFPLVDYEKRFTILYDHTDVLGPYSLTATQSVAWKNIDNIEALVKLNAPMQFNGTGATIASIQNGALLMVTLGSVAAGATAGIATIATRVRFMENDSL
jgi:hypothetical protein